MRRLWITVVLLVPMAATMCNASRAIAEQQPMAREDNSHKDLVGIPLVDQICGPKCVQYVLKYYGKEADVIDLTREMQYPNLDEGATLLAVADALEKRGVHTYSMQIAPKARLKWPFPVIVHLGGKDESMGHFVVWLSTSSGNHVNVWYGFMGTKQIQERDWARQRSGAVLLTAPQLIVNPEAAVEKVAFNTSEYALIAGGVATVIGIVFFVARVSTCRSWPSSFFSKGTK